MSTNASPVPGADRATGAWRLDPARSSVEFQVPHFYGLMTVKGHFDRYEGTLDLSARPAVELVIDADSLDTRQGKRDKHLRSADFFDVDHYPTMHFVSTGATRQANGEIGRAHV